MPNIRSAAKRMRQNEKRRKKNRIYRGSARTYIKQARAAMDGNDLDLARKHTMEAISSLDKAVSKGVLHKNNAARRKSRLMRRLAKYESKETS